MVCVCLLWHRSQTEQWQEGGCDDEEAASRRSGRTGCAACDRHCVFWTGIGTKNYYTQIDNTKVTEIEPDAGMTHSYTLVCYGEGGDEKTITFRTERVLRAEAYLKLTVAPLRGVVSWEEVSFEALPAAVQQAYAAGR